MGGRELGVQTLRWLCTLDWLEIVAVCPIPPECDKDAAELRKIIADNHLYECPIEELRNLVFDIGLSVNYNKIIPEDILQLCPKGFYNIHHSYNLRLRGRNIATHAILNCKKEKVYYHGTTLHKMVPKLDAGPIVSSAACEIEYNDTAYTLFKKADKLAIELIKEWFPRIAMQTVYLYYPPEEGIHYFKNKDLPSKEIPINILNGEEIYDYVRAFDFPGYEPAYIVENEKKHLVIRQRDGYTKQIELAGHCYYTSEN